MIERYQLPTAAELGLSGVKLVREPSAFTVQPDQIGSSEDELRARAEMGEWDLYETHDIDAESISLAALRSRFDDDYRSTGNEMIDEPGRFIDAVWNAQRVLPNAAEFAAYYVKSTILSQEEASVAEVVIDYDAPDTDENALARRTQHKLKYLANVSPDKAISSVDLSNQAIEYAMYASKGYAKHTALRHAHTLLMQARGLDEAEINVALDAMKDGVSIKDVMNPYRFAGLAPDAAEQLQRIKRPNRYANDSYKGAQSLAESVLYGSVADQVAVRQFFGGKNLVDMLAAQIEVARAIKSRGLSFSTHLIGLAMAGSAMVSVNTELANAHQSFFLDAETSEKLGIAPDTMARLGSLAAFAAHEPPLRNLLGHDTANMIRADYRILIDTTLAAKARINLKTFATLP